MIDNNSPISLISQGYEQIVKKYNEISIIFILKDNKAWIPGFLVEQVLGLMRGAINTLYFRHKKELEPYSSYFNLKYENNTRDHRCFDEVGFLGICFLSGAENAEAFRKWGLNVFKEISEKGYYIEKTSVGSIDWIIQQIDAMKAMAIAQKEQQERIKKIDDKVSIVNTELKSFEQKYEEEKIITPQTKKRIKDIVTDTRKRTGKHWGYYWSLIWNEFEINTTTNISEKLGQKIIKWMERNPEFYCIEEIDPL